MSYRKRGNYMEWYLIFNICAWSVVVGLSVWNMVNRENFAKQYNLFIDLWAKQAEVNQTLYDNQLKLESEIVELKKEKK